MLPKGMTTTFWLLAIGALAGVTGSIVVLHIRATSQLSTTRKRLRLVNNQNQVGRNNRTNENLRKLESQSRRRKVAADN